jgi:hypothetical protein
MEKEKITVTISEPVIKKVGMLEGGKNGLEVVYSTSMSRNGVRSKITDKGQKHLRPVHKDLRVLFKDLHETFLLMCGYNWTHASEGELMKGKVRMVSMMYDRTTDRIQLVGEIRVSDKYKFAVTGPTMNMGDVRDCEEVQVVVDKILEEAKMFANGIRGMERRDLSTAYMVQKQGLLDEEAEKAYDRMTAAEKEEMLTLAFEDCGLDVIEEDGKMVLGVKEDKEEKKPVVKEEKKGQTWVKPKESKKAETVDSIDVAEESVSEKEHVLSKKEESGQVEFELPIDMEETPEF